MDYPKESFIIEKKRQDFLIYQRIDPKNKRIVDDIITRYDLNNSPLKVVTKHYYTYLISRRVYLEDMTSSL